MPIFLDMERENLAFVWLGLFTSRRTWGSTQEALPGDHVLVSHVSTEWGCSSCDCWQLDDNFNHLNVDCQRSNSFKLVCMRQNPTLIIP